MRLFIAIDIPEQIKDELQKNVKILQRSCDGGKFSPRENYHITLAFLGEQPESRVKDITAAMDCCNAKPFLLTISGLGAFANPGGNVVWCGIEAQEGLRPLQQELASQLRLRHFKVEKREFTPHLTIARRVILKENICLADPAGLKEPISFTAAKMTLMRSELTSMGAKYTHLYEKFF